MKLKWESWNAEIENRCWAEAESVETDDIFDTPPYIQTGTPDVVFTPVGIYYEESPNRPSNRWQCFTCYTDFDIANTRFSEIIDNIKGVESYQPLGRYTFFIGFGKLFDSQEIREKIDEEAKKYVES